MRGFAFLGKGKAGWVDKEEPKLDNFGAILVPKTLSICTTDIHIVYGEMPNRKKGIILGHEGVGEVVKVGKEVKDFSPGDTVLVPAITPDWRSVDIQRGCFQHTNGMMSGWKFSNSKDGMMGEYFHVNDADSNMAMIPKGVETFQATMLSDIGSTGIYGAELAEIQPGDVTAIIGTGPVGLMAIEGAKLRGAGEIIAVGEAGFRNGMASRYGATYTIDFKDQNVIAEIMEITENQGVDNVIVTSGENSILNEAIAIVKTCGIVANINNFSHGEYLTIPRLYWGTGVSNKTIKGGMVPGGRNRMERLLKLVKCGRLNTTSLVTHKYKGLDSIEEAFNAMRDKPEGFLKPIINL